MGFDSPVRLRLPLLCLLVSVLVSSTPARASSFEEVPTDASTLSSMELRAAAAEPRDQCFLYTEILHGWTELAGRAMLAGDEAGATTAIEHADADADRLKAAISANSKRLKNAELLLDHSVHRMSDMLRASTMDQHDSVQTALHHVTTAHDALLAAVFAH